MQNGELKADKESVDSEEKENRNLTAVCSFSHLTSMQLAKNYRD